MQPRKTSNALLLLCMWTVICVLARATIPSTPPILQEVASLEDGTHVEVQVFPGASHWSILRNYFTAAHVVINCPNHRHYTVFIGRDVETAREEYAHERKAWCGLERYLGTNLTTCIVSVPTFGPTAVAVRIPKVHLENSSPPHAVCTMDRTAQFSTLKFLATVVGVFLFHSAPQLATSTPFRLAGGSLCFASLSLILLLFLAYRSLPYKRSVVVASFLFGSSVAAGIRYIFGVWIPSLGQLVRNPLFLAYFGISWLLGLALTYYYDDTSNYKVNTLLRVALQLTGLAMVTASAPSYHGLALVGVILLATYVYTKSWHLSLWNFGRNVDTLGKDKVTPIKPEEEGSEGEPERDELGTPKTPPPRRKSQGSGEHADEKVSPLIQMGMVLNVQTGRTIKIGNATYNSLVLKGYEVDKVAGTITPPSIKLTSKSKSKST